jgi:hypothetical protein
VLSSRGAYHSTLTHFPKIELADIHYFLLVTNDKATNILRANGYKVGFFGADLSQFPPAA